MQVRELIRLLSQYDPEATVVVCDRTEFLRTGMTRPLQPAELRTVQLANVTEDEGTWVCGWGERPDSECEGPLPGLLIGPP